MLPTYQAMMNIDIVTGVSQAKRDPAARPAAELPMARNRLDPDAAKDRRTARVILSLVAIGWLAALGLMAFAALYWDKG